MSRKDNFVKFFEDSSTGLMDLGDSFFGTDNRRENPIDDGGPGFNDEQGDKRGEQHGMELDIHAENRPRNEDGEFI